MEKKRILIVEDDLALSTMYKIKFEKEGFDVMLSSDGLVAVSHVTDYEPDVILLDIMMPHMDGFETLKVIRQLAPSLKTKIIMFSNLSSKDDIQKCMEYGADDYIIKANTTPKETVEKVKNMLGMTTDACQEADIKISCKSEGRIKLNCPHCEKEISICVKREG